MNNLSSSLIKIKDLFNNDSDYITLLNEFIICDKNTTKFFRNITNKQGEYFLLSKKIENFIKIVDNAEYKNFIQEIIINLCFINIEKNEENDLDNIKAYIHEILSHYSKIVKSNADYDITPISNKFKTLFSDIIQIWIESVAISILALEKFRIFSKEQFFELYKIVLKQILDNATTLVCIDNHEELFAIIATAYGYFEAELYDDATKHKERNLLEFFSTLQEFDEMEKTSWRQLLSNHLSKFKEEPEGFIKGGMKEIFQTFKEVDTKLLTKNFTDIIWLSTVKTEFNDIIDYFKNKEEYIKFKVKVPKGILLHWNPGTGKTLIAKAFAKEVGVSFFYISASEFIELYVGMWAKKVRDLFNAARKKKNAIIYIDEIDALWSREKGESSENRQTLNQLLTEMDWFELSDSIIVIASTNNVHDLDSALLRSWRFDKKIYVPLPLEEERKKLFSYYLNTYTPEIKFGNYNQDWLFIQMEQKELDELFLYLAKESAWMSPADIESVVNESILLSFRDHKHTCFNKDYIENAIKKNKKGFMFDDKTNIKEIYWKDIPYTFNDIIWLKSVKEEFKDVIYYLENRKSFAKYKIKMPKGILLYGPPGTWKTTVAKALAKEAWVPFFYTNASDFQSDSFVATWTQNVKKLFAKAREKSPCIIFIDELDAIWSRNSLWSETQWKILNQLLTEIDGFTETDDIFIMWATNFKERIDPALLREGRFDKKIMVHLPDKEVRKELFEYYIGNMIKNWSIFWESKNKKYSEEEITEILKNLVKKTTYFSPAKIEALVKDAGLSAKRIADVPVITAKLLDDSWRKIVIGVKNDLKVSTSELSDTAYHEAGHAVVARYYGRPVNEISVISAGWALGYMLKLDKDNKPEFSSTKKDLEDNIDISMGGRIAEQLFLDKITTGISWDMENVTSIIKAMADDYKFFGIFLPEKDKLKYQQKEFENSEKRVKKILSDHKIIVDKIVENLLDKEILNQSEFEEIWLTYNSSSSSRKSLDSSLLFEKIV